MAFWHPIFKREKRNEVAGHMTSENYDIFLLFLDMSKAFDTVNRSKLMEILKNIVTPSELHMMYLLIKDVILNVNIGDIK